MTAAALALPSIANASGFFWQHQDAAGIAAAAARGMKRASSQDWTSGTSQDRARDFRGWLVARAWVAGCLAGTVTMQGESGPLLIANDYPAVIRAVNKGVLLSDDANRSPVARDVEELVKLLGHKIAAEAHREKRSLFQKLLMLRPSDATE